MNESTGKSSCERLAGWRRAARRLAYWLLPTLAVLSWFITPALGIRRTLSPTIWGLFNPFGMWDYDPSVEAGRGSRRRLSGDERLIVYGDHDAETNVSRQKAIFKRWPDNPVYRGNYISEYISELCSENEDFAMIEQELAAASLAEPDNARYPLLLAALRAERAASIDQDEALVVADRQALDEAMNELLEALERPDFKRYAREMQGERLAILGNPRSMLESIERVSIAAGILLPDLMYTRNLAKTSRLYGLLLAKEGRPEEAAPFAGVWKRLAEHVQNDAFTLIDVLVTSSLVSMGEQHADIFDVLGEPDKAEHDRSLSRHWNRPVKDWRETVEAYNRERNDTDLSWRMGVLDALLIPALGEPVLDAELKAGRMVEYTLIEQSGVLILHSLAIFLMAGGWILGLYWRFRKTGDASTAIVHPRFSDYVRILGCGLFIPLAMYAILVAIPWVGGRQWSASANKVRLLAQIASLIIIVSMLTAHLIRRAVRERVRAWGMAIPPLRPSIRFANRLTVILISLAAVLAFLPYPADTPMRWPMVPVVSLFMLGGTVLLRLILTVCRLPSWLASRYWGGYFGTVARSAVPLFAALVILLAWVLLPVLHRREARHVAQASWGRSSPTGFSAPEDRITERLIEGMKTEREAWKNPDAPLGSSR